MKCVIPWMDALLWIQVLCVILLNTWRPYKKIHFSKATGFHHFQINVIKQDFYKRMVSEFSKMIN